MPMNLPELYEESSSRVKTEVFLGLNRAARIGDGEFRDMKNLTSDEYPVLSVRPPRERYFPWSVSTVKFPVDPSCLFAASPHSTGKSLICYLEQYGSGQNVYYGLMVGNTLARLGLESAEGRSVVRMGAYAIVLPDMVYVNTVNTNDFGPIKDEYVAPTGLCTYISVADEDGNSPEYVSDTRPTGDVENGALWHRTAEGENAAPPGLFRYNEEEGTWKEEISYIAVEIQKGQISPQPHFVTQPLTFKRPLAAGHAIRIQGIHEAVDGDRVIQAVQKSLDQKEIIAFTVQGIISTGVDRKEITESSPVRIERPIPKLDFACEAGNRIWGCRYENNSQSVNSENKDINEIYCCARGDFYRWIQGASDDPDAPVTFSIGTDGAWTGAICYQGYPTFFKENVMHRVSGTGASGYALYDNPCVGVGRGCERSLAIVGNVLYYKSAGPVMAFDGSSPVAVSEKLGRLTGYTHAVGGACGEKYYLSIWKDTVSGEPTEPVLYVLDTARGLWHKEDETHAESMASIGDVLYMSVPNTDTITVGAQTYTPSKIIHVVGGEKGNHTERAVPWYAETGIIGMESESAKYLSKISVRLAMDMGSTVRISVQYDSMGTFKQLMAVEADRMKVVSLPILPVRCDHLRLRLEGVGSCRLFSLTKTFEEAEEL